MCFGRSCSHFDLINVSVINRQVIVSIGVRANIHLGGQTEFCPSGFGGGGGSSRNFQGSIFSGGGG